MSSLSPNNYVSVLAGLKEKIRNARLKAIQSVNRQLLMLYWEIGNTILEQQRQEGWGAKVIDRLAADFKVEFEDNKGLSARNLKYMRAFAEAYPDFPIVQAYLAQLEGGSEIALNPANSAENQGSTIVPLAVAQFNDIPQNIIVQLPVAQIHWTHHRIILDKCNIPEERLFYARKLLEQGWNKNVLSLQIEQKLYERNGKAITNFAATLPAHDSDLAREAFKNPYIFDFLSLGEKAHERDLERALIQHLKSFMLELGKGFAYVGNQYNLTLEGDDFFLDLLFFNYKLNCFVIFELKIGEFKPEYAGKLNFYINAVNEQVRDEHHKPTIGVLLCRTPNDTVVKYSLAGIDQPMSVSDYHLAKALPKEIKGDMPTVAELEAEIEKEYEELKNPSEKKMDRIKELLKGLKTEGVKQPKTKDTAFEIFQQVILPVSRIIETEFKDIALMFTRSKMQYRMGSYSYNTIEEARKHLVEHPMEFDMGLELSFEGFIEGGVNAFYSRADIRIYLHEFKFIISKSRNEQTAMLERMYHQIPNEAELKNKIVDPIKQDVLDDIIRNVERIREEEQK